MQPLVFVHNTYRQTENNMATRAATINRLKATMKLFSNYLDFFLLKKNCFFNVKMSLNYELNKTFFFFFTILETKQLIETIINK